MSWTPESRPSTMWADKGKKFAIPTRIVAGGIAEQWGKPGDPGIGPMSAIQDEPDPFEHSPPTKSQTDYVRETSSFWQESVSNPAPPPPVRRGFAYDGPKLKTGANLQEFRAIHSHTANPVDAVPMRLSLYENGTLLLDGPDENAEADPFLWKLYVLKWDASLLSDPLGRGVEVEVRFTATGLTRGQIGALRWYPNFQGAGWTPEARGNTTWTPESRP